MTEDKANRPTQVQQPWRTTVRTTLQTLVGAVIVLGVVVPEVVEIVLDEAGQSMPESIRGWLLAAAGVTAAAAAIVTRVMAIPRVEDWLARRVPSVAAGARHSSRE